MFFKFFVCSHRRASFDGYNIVRPFKERSKEVSEGPQGEEVGKGGRASPRNFDGGLVYFVGKRFERCRSRPDVGRRLPLRPGRCFAVVRRGRRRRK